MNRYFKTSDQMDIYIKSACNRLDDQWRASALLLQRVSEQGGNNMFAFEDENQENWKRAKILGSSLKPEEMLDQSLDPSTLLYRLYHEDGVIIYPEHQLLADCGDCEGRISQAIRSLSKDDLEYAQVDGKIEVTCEFCRRAYSYEIENLTS